MPRVVRVPVGRAVGQRGQRRDAVGERRPLRRHGGRRVVRRWRDRAWLLRREQGVHQRQQRRADRGEDRQGDYDAPVQGAVVDELLGHDRQHQHDGEDHDEPDRDVRDDRREGRLVALVCLDEQAHVQHRGLDDQHDHEKLEEPFGTDAVVAGRRHPDHECADQQDQHPRHHARQREPRGAARGEVRLEDRDSGEPGQQQDRHERLADDAVLVADEHPYDADEGRRDEGADRDPDRSTEDPVGLR